MADFYCKVSHTVQDGVTKIAVTVRREQFRADDIHVKATRAEQAVMKALKISLILTDLEDADAA